MTWLSQAMMLTRSELRQELRDLELVLSTLFFALVLVVLFALAFASAPADLHARMVPGALWLSLALVGALTLTRLFEREQRADTLRYLLSAPVERISIYTSKVVTAVVLVGMAGLLLVPGFTFVFPGASGLSAHPLQAFLVLVLGVVGYCALGTIFAAGIATGGGRAMLLTVALYPLSAPVLLFAFAATQRVSEGHPGAMQTMMQLAATDLILLAVGALLFEVVLVGSPAREQGELSRGPDPAARHVTENAAEDGEKTLDNVAGQDPGNVS